MSMVVDLADYTTPMDAAADLGLNYATLMARIDRGKIKTIRVGRFHLIHKDEVKKARNDDNNSPRVVGATR
jgi:excisionase family DNA binding protein